MQNITFPLHTYDGNVSDAALDLREELAYWVDDLADKPTILLSAETESDDPPVVHGEDDPVDEPVSPVPLIGQLLQVPH